MSALAKPMIHSSRASRFTPVNAEEVLTFEKLTATNPVGSTNAKYVINFSMKSGNAPKNIEWAYDSESDMNDDHAAILGLISTVTP